MRTPLTKISLFILLSLLVSCNAVKRVAEDERLLTKNRIFENGERINSEAVKSQIAQKPNTTILGYPFRLNLYNLARPNPDSSFAAWLHRKPKREERWNKFLSEKQVKRLGKSFWFYGKHQWLKEIGEAPTIIDEAKAQKTLKRLEAYYFNRGFFNAEAEYEIIPSKRPQRASIDYNITTGEPYFIDSITSLIVSPAIDSLYKARKRGTLLRPGDQFDWSNFEGERRRLSNVFRNSGVYNFQPSSIRYEIDSTASNNKMPVDLIISNIQKRSLDGSTEEIPYTIHKIKEVNIYTDDSFINEQGSFTDSTTYNKFNIYSKGKLRYRPKALTDAVFINPGDVYSDVDRSLTYKQFSNLRTFKYPNINYQYADSTNNELIANILLTPRKRFSLGFDFDLSHSNIQDIGVSFITSMVSRNIFRGAETLEVSLRGTLGSSRNVAADDSRFFNLSEVGGDIRLNFPRFFFPFNTEKLIPKYMSPTTSIALGTSIQENIGLDKQSFTGLLSYKWSPSKWINNNLELINIEFINNKNPDNYFNIYLNSFDRLNDLAVLTTIDLGPDGRLEIPGQANTFLEDAINGVYPELTADDIQVARVIDERKTRLTENNLIFASNYTFIRNNRENILDKEFSQFRAKLELAGNLLSATSDLFKFEENRDGNKQIFDVAFTQYVKTELDYIKHFRLSQDQVLAFRSFAGIAIPYGNSSSIPFNRSYFAGGSNDNRGWEPYSLGPGSSGAPDEFNEANFKLAMNLEYRFDIAGNLKGALFADAGNIWNIFDNVEDSASKFDGLPDLDELALGSGFGLRYDVDFFVLRFDLGFRTYDPALPSGNRWFRDYNFGNSTLNIGINYPF
ncbi:BamA/TamA family outer membrane protein [Sungkyunkwania multivorans]|uniref:BamA/TamA family outer membrane protein n=1 Tax=Sungkyunkwania multivorans TaxID=1173618 RepID=A0ABW3CYY1_9FLAO